MPTNPYIQVHQPTPKSIKQAIALHYITIGDTSHSATARSPNYCARELLVQPNNSKAQKHRHTHTHFWQTSWRASSVNPKKPQFNSPANKQLYTIRNWCAPIGLRTWTDNKKHTHTHM